MALSLFTTINRRTVRRIFPGVLDPADAGAARTASAPDGVRTIRMPAGGAAETGTQDMAAITHATLTARSASVLAPTEGLGGQPLPFEMDGDVKVFRLTCQLTQWEFAPGKRVEAWTYNRVVPGPEIRVTEGDKVRIEVANDLPESTSVHWHGLMVPATMDGVPFVSQMPIKPEQSFTYEFQVPDGNVGPSLYHSHHNTVEQVTRGLLGAFIVEPKAP